MQGTIKVYKLTSKEHPNKEWESVGHFFNATADREAVRKEKQAGFQKEAEERIKEGGWYNGNFLSDDKKSVLKIEVTHDRVHEHTKKYWIDLHVESGKLIIEEIFSKSVSLEESLQISKLFNFAKFSWSEWNIARERKQKRKKNDDNK